MDDKLLKFVKLVDHGSYTKAAQALHISQPALSTTISNLEKELKVELIVRHNRGIKLTSAGQVVYDSALRMQGISFELKDALSELGSVETTIRIGIIDSIAEQLFGSGQDVGLSSDQVISVTIDNTQRIIDGVQRGDIDFGIITHPNKLSSNLVIDILGSEKLSLVVRPQLEDEFRAAIQRGIAVPFLAYNEASNTFQIVDTALRSNHVTPRYKFYSTSPQILLSLALAGRGATMLPNFTANEHVQKGDLVEIPKLSATRVVCLVHRSTMKMSSGVDAVVAQVKTLLK